MIQDTINAVVLVSTGPGAGSEIEVELAYDEENDPLAIQMIFKVEEEVCWIMARDLMMRGSTSMRTVGDGDVRVGADYTNGRVVVCLNSPGGHADVGLDREELIDFLNRTQAVCPLGQEPIDELVERELADLLSEGDPT